MEAVLQGSVLSLNQPIFKGGIGVSESMLCSKIFHAFFPLDEGKLRAAIGGHIVGCVKLRYPSAQKFVYHCFSLDIN